MIELQLHALLQYLSQRLVRIFLRARDNLEGLNLPRIGFTDLQEENGNELECLIDFVVYACQLSSCNLTFSKVFSLSSVMARLA